MQSLPASKKHRVDNDLEVAVERARGGCDRSMELVMRSMEREVRLQAARFYAPGESREDLLQAGRLGVLSAVRSYRAGLGVGFRLFASMCARRQVLTLVNRANNDSNAFYSGCARLDQRDHTTGDDDASTLGDHVPSPTAGCPATIACDRDALNRAVSLLDGRLTEMERVALQGVMAGQSYAEMLEAHPEIPGIKALDNAILRMRGKARRLLEEEGLVL